MCFFFSFSNNKNGELTRTATNWAVYTLVCDGPVTGTILIDDEPEGVGDGDNGQAGYGEGFYKCRNLLEFISIKMQHIKGICPIFARNLFSGVDIKLNKKLDM